MAFDQNHIPKDLRPINVARTIPEEPRIAVLSTATAPTIATATVASRNPEIFANPDGSIPVFYPITVSDSGFVSLGYGGPAPWAPRLPVPVGSVNSPNVGFGYSPNLGNRMVSNAVDHAGNDIVAGSGSSPLLDNRINSNGSNELTNVGSGYNPIWGTVEVVVALALIMGVKRVGMIQYRIISVRRDVSFNELVQKMVDTYGQPVVIKYQLPDEDLDALVSVSCTDDLDNMMDEYEKLVERSSDGSAKLRVFLFSAMELDTSGMVQFGDLHDSGQRYVDAVNGIADGVGSGIAWKESIASATSTQNSDFSGTEAVDSSGTGQVDISGAPTASVFSPRGDLATSQESNPKFVPVEPNPPIHADASAVSLGIPVVKSGPPQTLSSQPEVEFERSIPVSVPQQQLGYDFQQAGMGIPPPAPHLQAYADHRQEITNHADYMYLPAQMRFPNAQLLGLLDLHTLNSRFVTVIQAWLLINIFLLCI
ncbi:hypothetical protein GH714_013340 [Hevea brasiliensis]|uniref:PB1 domain-containing protein n=1 Tax=Hevea brasiliensis TaxID=3981 RepID=A0A6A6MDQ7_HEVBR|nr:hypothetical protein GH714_013340 [Hevea brasiliensis]